MRSSLDCVWRKMLVCERARAQRCKYNRLCAYVNRSCETRHDHFDTHDIRARSEYEMDGVK